MFVQNTLKQIWKPSRDLWGRLITTLDSIEEKLDWVKYHRANQRCYQWI